MPRKTRKRVTVKSTRRAAKRRSSASAASNKTGVSKSVQLGLGSACAHEHTGDHYGLTIASLISMIGIVFIVWMVFTMI